MSNIDMTKVEKAPDPEIVHMDADSQWYFWDETYVNRHGPYATALEAHTALEVYVQEHLG